MVVWEQVEGADPRFSLDSPHLLANLSFFLSLETSFYSRIVGRLIHYTGHVSGWCTGEKETKTGKLQDFKGDVACLVA